MQFPKVPLFLGVASLTISFAAHAQNAPSPAAPRSLTTVDNYGNMVRNPNVNSPAASQNLGANNLANSNRYQRGDGRGDGRNDNRGGRNDGRDYNRNNGRFGGTYYFPASPYAQYPYGVHTYNNYYPSVPNTTIVTGVPYGTIYNGYAAPGYAVPGYGYGYPLPSYGNYYSPYTGVPYSAYGSTTYITGGGFGGIYSQSQTSGYGVSVGRGGVSAHFGGSRSNNSTGYKRR